MKKIIYSLVTALFFALTMQGSQAQAQTEINVTRGTVEAMPVAISTFYADDESNRDYAVQIPQVISANLENSGLFRPLNPRSFIQDPSAIEKDGVRFAEWRATGTQALVTGRVTKAPDGRSRVEFRLWDVFSQKQLSGVAYMTTSSNWRRVAHIISDEIYSRLTGEDGYFDSRIVYISESGPTHKRQKRLAIMDQDGANHRYLTDGQDLVLTPRFSPNSQTIAYLSYKNNRPRVYIYNINTGAQEELGAFPGMTFSPRFSPDGRKVIMSFAQNGNSDLYEMDLRTKRQTRLTTNPAIDTSPSYSPDGRYVVFESDRGGSQQLYVMSMDTKNPQRITFGKGRYGNPVWSPRGDLIAFTRMYQGQFYIGVIRPDGSGERLITTAYHVEGPSWSPNGRVLTYFKENPTGRKGEGRESRIYTIDITGFNERIIKTPQHGSDPAWSPVNK